MMDQVFIDYLKIFHGVYNTIIALFYFYHGSLGRRIRKERTAGEVRDFSVVKRHRRLGPLLALLGLAGYLAGLVLVLLDKGRLLAYPLHLLAGSVLALSIAAAYLVSRSIQGPASPGRTMHGIIGLAILVLYVFQIVLGLDILL